MRSGPKPLPVHLGLAVSSAAQTIEDTPKILETMLLGIKKYQAHPYQRDLKPLPCVWQEGEVQIFKALAECKTKNSNPIPIVLIPSMINKSTVLDLMPERSLTRWLAQQGRDVYLLDWGSSINDTKQFSDEQVIRERLVPALHYVAEQVGRPIHTLGYCMGGTLLSAAVFFAKKDVHSIVFLASPWDFHAGDQVLKSRVAFWAPSSLSMINEHGYLPVDWVQTVFASMDPVLTARKFSDFAAMDPNDLQARLFVAVEDWLNDGVDIPATLSDTCIQQWYIQNNPMRGEWKLGKHAVRLEDIECPCLIVASKRDKLVPPESSLAMKAYLKDADVLEPDSGHIGMIAGEHAVDQVWQKINQWLIEKDALV